MGRKATGRSQKLVRFPVDLDHNEVLRYYTDIRPVLDMWAEMAATKDASSPRWENVCKVLDECGYGRDGRWEDSGSGW
jgi:hypothetical protein